MGWAKGQAESERAGSGWAESERAGSGWAESERAGSGRAGSGRDLSWINVNGDARRADKFGGASNGTVPVTGPTGAELIGWEL